MSACSPIILFFVFALISNTVFAYRIGEPEGFSAKLSQAAINRTKSHVQYNGEYVRINYPNGDVPEHIGVCTDLVIRSYRKLGVDLQKDLHEDIKQNFISYPKIWGLKKPDTNIDHRRVPNLQRLFERHGKQLSISTNGANYKTGDLVTWMLGGNLPHIGIVIDALTKDGKRPLIAHNIGNGPEIEDMIFKYKITGHYRYYGALK